MPEPTLAEVLHDVWHNIHVRRFNMRDGAKGIGPDNFYNGTITAANEVLRVAKKYGLTEQEVYRGPRDA